MVNLSVSMPDGDCSTLGRAPAGLATEIRFADALQWYTQGRISRQWSSSPAASPSEPAGYAVRTLRGFQPCCRSAVWTDYDRLEQLSRPLSQDKTAEFAGLKRADFIDVLFQAQSELHG
jgi:hypothetical protein